MNTFASRNQDPGANLILRTLLAPAAIVAAVLFLLAPVIASAEPVEDERVYMDASGEGAVKRVEIRQRTTDDGVELTFLVKVADRSVERVRAEWSAVTGWDSTTLEPAGFGRFAGRVTLPTATDVDFFLLGTDSNGRVGQVRYATLTAPATVQTSASSAAK